MTWPPTARASSGSPRRRAARPTACSRSRADASGSATSRTGRAARWPSASGRRAPAASRLLMAQEERHGTVFEEAARERAEDELMQGRVSEGAHHHEPGVPTADLFEKDLGGRASAADGEGFGLDLVGPKVI